MKRSNLIRGTFHRPQNTGGAGGQPAPKRRGTNDYYFSFRTPKGRLIGVKQERKAGAILTRPHPMRQSGFRTLFFDMKAFSASAQSEREVAV